MSTAYNIYVYAKIKTYNKTSYINRTNQYNINKM